MDGLTFHARSDTRAISAPARDQHQGADAGQRRYDVGLGGVLADAGMLPASMPTTISISAWGTAMRMLMTEVSGAMLSLPGLHPTAPHGPVGRSWRFFVMQ